MDTCCRSGNFDEALDLRAFVNKVKMLSQPDRWQPPTREHRGSGPTVLAVPFLCRACWAAKPAVRSTRGQDSYVLARAVTAGLSYARRAAGGAAACKRGGRRVR